MDITLQCLDYHVNLFDNVSFSVIDLIDSAKQASTGID